MRQLPDTITLPRDPRPNSLHTIAHVMPSEYMGDPCQALYFTNGAPAYLPVVAWCGVRNAKGKYVGGDEDEHDIFGLVIVGNRLEIPDTDDTFIAYIRNIDDQTEHNLIADWRRIHNI